jgi:hypothetical protein
MTVPMNSGSVMVRNARAIGLVAVAIGLLAQYLFVDAALGINVPVATASLLAAGWAIRDRSKPWPRWPDAWFAPGALVLSIFVALRGDTTLEALDVLGAIVLTGAAVVSFAGLRVLEQPVSMVVALAGRLSLSAMAGGGAALTALVGILPRLRGAARNGPVAQVARGIAIAVPLVLLFVFLFASADAVFRRIVEDLFDWHLDLGSLPGRLVATAVVAWLAAGLLMFVARGEDQGSGTPMESPAAGRPRLGSTEAVTVLVVLDLLFAGFVLVQATYLFGGKDTLDASGLTYAGYARRGFFELLAVAFMVGGLVLTLEAFVRRRTLAYLASAIALAILTMVVLASAFLRLRLYQEAYGWTELRFYVLAAIFWLGIGAVMAIVALATDRTRWLAHGLLVLAFGFGIGFNLIGPVHYIAERNIERAVHPELVPPDGESGLDVYYLASLGDDALPILSDNLCSLPSAVSPDAFNAVKTWSDRIARDASSRPWQAWNLSRERARDLKVFDACRTSQR